MRRSHQLLAILALSFLASGFLEAKLGQQHATAIAIIHGLLIGVICYAWVKAESIERNATPPSGTPIMAGLFPIVGVPIYLFKTRNIRNALTSTALAIALVFVLSLAASMISEKIINNAAENSPSIGDTGKSIEHEEVSNPALAKLIERNLAFLPGSYAAGKIPKGEYIFVSDKGGYYAEERDGQIIDNENFNSFGYVFNHAIGDITSHGALISVSAIKELGISGAKELYELITKQKNYSFSGHYKAGVDIPAGRYFIESAGQAYMEVNQGPVGNGKILSNANFNGTKTINLRDGQYLKIHNASIAAATK